MHLPWVVLLITVTTSLCQKANPEKEAIFARDMRGELYNVADTGIMMGLGKRSFQSSVEDTGNNWL